MSRSAALLALVLLVIGSVVVAPVLAQEGDGGAAARKLTLEELTPGGQKPPNAPDSVRQNGRYGEFVVKELPTGLLVDESEQSTSWRYLRPGTTIKRNHLQLWSKRAYGASDETYVVEIAYYQVGKQTVTNPETGTTRQETTAKNVTTHTQKVEFGGGYDYARIDLRDHYDGKVRTVMCVRQTNRPSCLENPGETRWTFYHHSSKATLPIDTNSAGARLGWAIVTLLLPFFGATVTTLYAGKKFVEAAKAGPQISAIWWVLAAVGGVIALIAGWDWFSNTLIRAPYLVPVAAGILLGVIAVEWFGRRTYGVGFLQFQLTDGFDPSDPESVEKAFDGQSGTDHVTDDSGDPRDAPGVLKAKFIVAQFARGDDGARSAIRKGIRKFWARARGATADLEVDGNMQTKIDVDGPIEELYLLDPEDDDPIEYLPEHHSIEWPDLVTYDDDGNVQIHPVPYLAGGFALAVSWMAGALLAGSGLLGLFVGALAIFATKIAQPRDGRLFARLAPVHYHHAVGSMLTHARGLADAKSWDDWFRSYAESEADKKAERKDLLEDRSQTQMERITDRYLGEANDDDAPVRGREEAPADD